MLFTDVLFPLLTQLLKPEVWHSDPAGMGETRLQAAVLCCKAFLRYEDVLFEPPVRSDAETVQNETEDDEEPGVAIWAQILEVLERFVKSGASQADGLDEAVPESIKNILLVMASAGYIAPPPPPVSRPVMDAQQQEHEAQEQEHGRRDAILRRKLWNVTAARLERFLPGMLADVFPPPPAVATAPAAQPVVKEGVQTTTAAAQEQTQTQTQKEAPSDNAGHDG